MGKAQEEILAVTPDGFWEEEETETTVALVHEAGRGLVDSRCGQGLVGEVTLRRHEALAKFDLTIKDLPHRPHSFRYGNGTADTSIRTVQMPIFLASIKVWLRLHAVKESAPLYILISAS